MVRYVGYLPDGTIFDATGDGEPFRFRLGGREAPNTTMIFDVQLTDVR